MSAQQCTCNFGCNFSLTSTQRKINVLKGPAVQSKAMRYAEYARVTPGLSTVHNKKPLAATKAKLQWLTGCPTTTGGSVACGGHNQTTLDDMSFRYSYPFSLFPRR